MPAETFSVLITGPLPERAKLCALLCKIHNILPDEGAKMARECWGILGDNMDQPKAQACVQAARSAAIETVLIPSSRAKSVPAPQKITKAAPSARGLECVSQVVKITAPWESIYLLAAAPVKTEIRQMVKTEGKAAPDAAQLAGMTAAALLTGIPIKFGSQKQEQLREDVKRDAVFMLDIFCDAELPHMRIFADDFDYAPLGAKKTYSSQTNFREFTLLIAARAPKAAKNAGLAAMSAGKPLVTLSYDSQECYDRELRRLFLLRNAGR
ncbi:MAG: hypothetical protein WC421_02505 [Elusimicrobiales bacterium]